MSAIRVAKAGVKAFTREKPHSSITTLVDILTSSDYESESYDGIPELANSIDLQSSGPSETSRALRKKLKHGDPHRQYRALVILKALVENCGRNFQTTFADVQLTDVIKNLGTDPSTDPKVKRKLLSVLASWHNQFKSDPAMALVAGLFRQCGSGESQGTIDMKLLDSMGLVDFSQSIKRKEEKKEKARKAKREKELAKKEEQRRRMERAPFDFEKEKPQVLNSIANASQASNNLVNAIVLVNQESDSVLTNERVQECLANTKQARKAIVMYIQLVENEELIGTLIETNDRIITALEMYDDLSSPKPAPAEDSLETENPAYQGKTESEIIKLQARQKAALERAREEAAAANSGHVHPDLQDLSFGPLGNEKMNLPPPLRPSVPGSSSPYADLDAWQHRGSLSDFSDYASSDEGHAGSRRSYSSGSDEPAHDDAPESHADDGNRATGTNNKLVDVDDPFADPFA